MMLSRDTKLMGKQKQLTLVAMGYPVPSHHCKIGHVITEIDRKKDGETKLLR